MIEIILLCILSLLLVASFAYLIQFQQRLVQDQLDQVSKQAAQIATSRFNNSNQELIQLLIDYQLDKNRRRRVREMIVMSIRQQIRSDNTSEQGTILYNQLDSPYHRMIQNRNGQTLRRHGTRDTNNTDNHPRRFRRDLEEESTEDLVLPTRSTGTRASITARLNNAPPDYTA